MGRISDVYMINPFHEVGFSEMVHYDRIHLGWFDDRGRLHGPDEFREQFDIENFLEARVWDMMPFFYYGRYVIWSDSANQYVPYIVIEDDDVEEGWVRVMAEEVSECDEPCGSDDAMTAVESDIEFNYE